MTSEELRDLVGGISEDEKNRILIMILWDIFGQLTDDEDMIIDWDRYPDRADVSCLVQNLRDEFR